MPGSAIGSPGEREALVGAMLAGAFGLAWALWGASGLDGTAAAIVRAAGIVLGLAIVGTSGWLRRCLAHDEGSGRMFASRGYRVVVVAEVGALVGGGALLGATGHSEYAIAWYAGVVGLHFLLLGRLYWPGFLWVGGALLAAGAAGAIVGLAGDGAGAVHATSGLTAAVTLFVAGSWAVQDAWPVGRGSAGAS